MSTVAPEAVPTAPGSPLPATAVSTKELRKVSLASLLATSIEWYDFYVYATLAAIIFPHVFFAEVSPAVGAVLSFATMAAGFVSRPLGALVFGRIGDQVGRKAMLVTALVTIGVVSLGIGLVPGYASIGASGAVILTVLRFLQGLAVGGQWGGAVLLIAEKAPAKSRGFYAGIAQQGVPAGLISSGLAVAILTNVLSRDDFASWGWRLPFFLGAVLTVLALVLILRVEDTVAAKGVSVRDTGRPSVLAVFKSHPKALIVGFAAQLGLTTGAYIQGTWTANYATSLIDEPVARADILWPGIAGSVVSVGGIFFFSWLSDRVGRRIIMLSGFVFAIMWIYPLLLMYSTGSLPLIWLASLVYAIPHSMMFGPLAALLTELFTKDVRATGISISYQLGGTLGGGIASVVAAALFLATNSVGSVAIYVAGALVLGFAGTMLARDRRTVSLN
jgi:MFS family permease